MRRRFRREEATRWVWIIYGLTQAVITMLMAFGVIEGTTLTSVVTGVALITYVAVNELYVRTSSRATHRELLASNPAQQHSDVDKGNDGGC